MFRCYYFFSMTNNEIISAFSLIVSVSTFLIAYCAYNRFLVRQLRQKQLEVVLDFINSIHNSKNRIEIHMPNNKRLTSIDLFSIFDLVEYSSLTNVEEIYFFNEDFLNWAFLKEYLTNPLLPKTIVNVLKKFQLKDKTDYERHFVFNKNAVIIGNVETPMPNTPIFYVTNFENYLNSISDLKQNVIELKKVIMEWLKEYGINDVNLNIED